MSNAQLNIDRDGLEFIAHWEGLKLTVYLDTAKKLTVGYGHLVKQNEMSKYPLGATITREEALLLFQADLQTAAGAVRRLTTPLNQNQFNALTSFAFNLGTKWLSQGSVFTAVSTGKFEDVPAGLATFNKETRGGKLEPSKGLTARREAEGKLFLATPPANGRSVLVSLGRLKA